MANGGAKSSKDKDSLIFVITVLGKHKPRPSGLWWPMFRLLVCAL